MLKTKAPPIVLSRGTILKSNPFGVPHSVDFMQYELRPGDDKLIIHVPPQLTLYEIFADIRELLKKVSFADILEPCPFATCTTLIFRLFQAEVSLTGFGGKVFEVTENLLTEYFSSLTRDIGSTPPIGFFRCRIQKKFLKYLLFD